MVTLVSWGTSMLFSTVAAPISMPTNSVGGFPFLGKEAFSIFIFSFLGCTDQLM